MKRYTKYLLCFSLLLAACQSPLALAPSLSLNTQSAVNTSWNDLTQLKPIERENLKTALVSRHSLQPHAIGRGLLSRLMPKMTQRYQYLLHPRTIRSERMPPRAQTLTLKSHDNHPLKAFWLPSLQPTKQAIIVVHGYQLNKYMAWEKYGFLNAHYNLLFFDLRAHNNQGGESTLGIYESRDLLTIIQSLQVLKKNESFALFGESMGASAAIVAGTQWSQSPAQSIFPLKAVWSDGAFADLDHAIEERVYKKLAQDLKMTPAFFKRWLANLVSVSFRSWLAEDTHINNAENAAAPRHYLPELVKKVDYAQIHSREDEQTSYENALILSKLARPQALEPTLFWPTRGKHVQSFKEPLYRQKALEFLSKAFH